MSGNRKAAEKIILEAMTLIDPSGDNTALMIGFFKTMTDKAFDLYMQAIENGTDYVSVVAPNLTQSKITTDNNLKVAKKLGVELFQRLWLTDNATGVEYLTNQKYLVVKLPVRRQIQTLENKMSIPEDNKHVDDLTDQPTGVSKGSSISFPELLVMYSQGNSRGIEELIKFRGGDIKAMQAMDKQIHESGGASLDSLGRLGTKVKSTQTLSVMMKGMHLDNNFLGD
jgi:hypothetical protein